MPVKHLSLMLLFLTACGDPDAIDFDRDSRQVPPVYLAPPDPCERRDDPGPLLALEWRSTLQSFVEAGFEPDSLLLDYDVWPAAHANRVIVGLDFDPLLNIEAVIDIFATGA